MPGQARPQLVHGQPAGEALELTRVVAQEGAKLVGEPVELAPEVERGFLEQLGRRAQAGRKPPHVIDATLDPTVYGVRQTLGEIVDPLRGTPQQTSGSGRPRPRPISRCASWPSSRCVPWNIR